MKKQAGFTLIELVIVIIILGILAVTAAPKFLNLQDDAKKSAAQGVQAAVSSSAQLSWFTASQHWKVKSVLVAQWLLVLTVQRLKLSMVIRKQPMMGLRMQSLSTVLGVVKRLLITPMSSRPVVPNVL